MPVVSEKLLLCVGYKLHQPGEDVELLVTARGMCQRLDIAGIVKLYSLSRKACYLAGGLLSLDVNAMLEDIDGLEVDLDGTGGVLPCPGDQVNCPPV